MTGNVARAITDELEWETTLSGIYDALRPGAYIVFETRDPAFKEWEEWNRAASDVSRSPPAKIRVDRKLMSGPSIANKSTQLSTAPTPSISVSRYDAVDQRHT
jgi:hypothetical protein